MPTEQRPLKRLSICPCGYAVLDDSIKLGTVYEIDTERPTMPHVYVCGNCRRRQRITVVLASQVLHPDWPRAPLPAALFYD